jgi:hypothetical protein
VLVQAAISRATAAVTQRIVHSGGKVKRGMERTIRTSGLAVTPLPMFALGINNWPRHFDSL